MEVTQQCRGKQFVVRQLQFVAARRVACAQTTETRDAGPRRPDLVPEVPERLREPPEARQIVVGPEEFRIFRKTSVGDRDPGLAEVQ